MVHRPSSSPSSTCSGLCRLAPAVIAAQPTRTMLLRVILSRLKFLNRIRCQSRIGGGHQRVLITAAMAPRARRRGHDAFVGRPCSPLRRSGMTTCSARRRAGWGRNPSLTAPRRNACAGSARALKQTRHRRATPSVPLLCSPLGALRRGTLTGPASSARSSSTCRLMRARHPGGRAVRAVDVVLMNHSTAQARRVCRSNHSSARSRPFARARASRRSSLLRRCLMSAGSSSRAISCVAHRSDAPMRLRK
jgi:hypothetical protein